MGKSKVQSLLHHRLADKETVRTSKKKTKLLSRDGNRLGGQLVRDILRLYDRNFDTNWIWFEKQLKFWWRDGNWVISFYSYTDSKLSKNDDVDDDDSNNSNDNNDNSNINENYYEKQLL